MTLLSELHQLSLPYLPRLPRRMVLALTARELECLRWASSSRTTWAIGRLPEIGEHTARFHLRNA
jgi:DNA-binding CsgD family transcriptional regulator